MAIKNKINCVIDNVEYEYCPNCDSLNETWRSWFCCENCRDIYHAINEDTEIKKRDALNNVDLSNRKNFRAPIEEKISKILGSKTKTVSIDDSVNTDPEMPVLDTPKPTRKFTKKTNYTNPIV